MVKVPVDEAVRERIRRFWTERQVDIRLSASIEELFEKGNIGGFYPTLKAFQGDLVCGA